VENARYYSNVFFFFFTNIFSWCAPNFNVAFKITNILKVNNDNLKFNVDFKSHIIVEKDNMRTLEEHLVFSIVLSPTNRKMLGSFFSVILPCVLLVLSENYFIKVK
jgi:hypothetical protein